VSVELLGSLRESARLSSTHYSTQIEGIRLTAEEVAVVAKGGTFPNRRRDETEVKNYFLSLDYLDQLIGEAHDGVTVEMVQVIHACVMEGKRSPSPFREGQNVICESGSGNIIYMPPEFGDVPALMEELVRWINEQLEEKELPAPVIAGVAHYQFATIHPYFILTGMDGRPVF
jgi:Fic family protein